MKKLLSNIKYVLCLLVLLTSVKTTAQAKLPFYEQLTFDFYQKTILDSFPVKKKITVYKYIINNKQYTPVETVLCIKDIPSSKRKTFSVLKAYQQNKTNFPFDDPELNTDSVNKKQFRVKEKKSKGHYPQLFIDPPITEKDNKTRIFVNLNEVHSETLTINYCLEFDADGRIINWCREEIQAWIAY
jgi:hypothetical protein